MVAKMLARPRQVLKNKTTMLVRRRRAVQVRNKSPVQNVFFAA